MKYFLTNKFPIKSSKQLFSVEQGNCDYYNDDKVVCVWLNDHNIFISNWEGVLLTPNVIQYFQKLRRKYSVKILY